MSLVPFNTSPRGFYSVLSQTEYLNCIEAYNEAAEINQYLRANRIPPSSVPQEDQEDIEQIESQLENVTVWILANGASIESKIPGRPKPIKKPFWTAGLIYGVSVSADYEGNTEIDLQLGPENTDSLDDIGIIPSIYVPIHKIMLCSFSNRVYN